MTRRFLILILLSITMLSAKCKKDDVDANGLPLATQSGKNTFGALVNGQVFVPDGATLFHSKITANYSYVYNHFVFSLKTSNLNVAGFPGFVFHGDSLKLKVGDQLTFVPEGSKSGISARYYAYASDYIVAAPLSGKITFTRVDTLAKILSANFSFDAVNNKGEKVSVTEGRFDVTYY